MSTSEQAFPGAAATRPGGPGASAGTAVRSGAGVATPPPASAAAPGASVAAATAPSTGSPQPGPATTQYGGMSSVPSAYADAGKRPAAAAPRTGGPRVVRLNVAKVDPWSVLKLSFLLSVGIGIATVVAAIVVWNVVDKMGVFNDINSLVQDVQESDDFDVLKYAGLDKVTSIATLIAVVNVILLTALSTLGAFLYNLSSGLVGGLHVTLTDE